MSSSAGGTLPSLEAARDASSTVPIVMIAVDYDPLAIKAITSLSRPGGNITGVFIRQVELTAKRLELLKEITPKGKAIALLSDPFTVDQLKAGEVAAKRLDIRLQPMLFKSLPYEYAAALSGRRSSGRVPRW